MSLELNVVKHKKGYRWRVYKNGDMVCTGTDYHATEREAENEAIRLFCKEWVFANEGGSDDRQT